MKAVTKWCREEVRKAEANARYVSAVLFKDERGDTNFVSILILMGIALALAAIFMVFRDRIVDWANGQFNVFNNSQAGASKLTTAETDHSGVGA